MSRAAELFFLPLLLWLAEASVTYCHEIIFNRNAFAELLDDMDTLQLHLKSDSRDSDNNFVQYLLHQQHCAVCVVNTAEPIHNVRNHFYLFTSYEQFEQIPLVYGKDLGDGFYIMALQDDSVTQSQLLPLALQLWLEYNLHKVVYVLPQASYFYNPFAQTNGTMVSFNDGSIATIFNNLNGYTLRVYIFDGVYSMVYGDLATNHVERIEGADSKVALLLSEKMNFSMSYAWPDNESFGARLYNGQFNGALGRILRNEMDLIMTGFFIKDYLTHDIDFSVAVYTDKLCMFVKKAERIPRSMLPMFAVRGDYWWGFGLGGICCVAGWLCLRALNQYLSNSRPLSFLTSWRSAAFTSWRICVDTWMVWVRVSIHHLPPHTSERVFVASVSLVSVIFGALLESSLASMYIRPMYYRDIDTLRQLDEAQLPIFIKHRPFKDDLLYGHDSEVYRNLDNKMRLLDDSQERLIEMVATRGNFAGVTRANSLQIGDISYIITKKIHKIPECPKEYHVAYVLRKHSPYQKTINVWLLRFKQAGLIRRWIGEMKELAKLKLLNSPEYHAFQQISQSNPLLLEDVRLGFYALFVGCAMAACVLGLEHVFSLVRSRQALREFHNNK